MTCTLAIVSHTHWDREWYQPFQEYRIRLVQMTDRLLDLLARDPDYRYFTFDGQTIILEDYLQVRPEQEATLRRYVQEGRLLIGPWYVLPDEFLVSPEATIRNLILGEEVARRFGPKMPVGYIPDPFGHISQLPQILRGFDLDVAVFWRGVGQAPNEFRWAAPDGTEVLVIHLRNGYGNAGRLPDDEEGFIACLQEIITSLAPCATTPHLLAMNGGDHLEPMPALSRLIAAADARLPDVEIRHSTLPQFVAAVRAAEPSLDLRQGEIRSPERANLLPGVFSARMWIKQRNAWCETLLEKWAEPFPAYAALHGLVTPTRDLQALTRQAWRYLVQNHPHDSICGCSVDAVHKEMDVRFDWVEQIGEEVTRQSLAAIAEAVDTTGLAGSPVVVFNPVAGPRTDVVTTLVSLPLNTQTVEAVDEHGEVVPCQVTGRESAKTKVMDLNRAKFLKVLAMTRQGTVRGEGIQAVETTVAGDTATVDMTLAPGPPAAAAVERGKGDVQALLADEQIQRFRVRLYHQEKLKVRFVARDVPGHGYRAFALCPIPQAAGPTASEEGRRIENELYAVEADAATGTLTVTDKATGTVFQGLGHFVDGGDRGDEYNYCPPERDRLVTAPSAPPTVRLVESGPVRWTLEIAQTYRVPASLGDDRAERSEKQVDLPITTRVSLSPGVRRIDFVTTVENHARDHRLRVHFPTPIHTDVSHAEGHFDVVTRPLALPQPTEDWPEQPVPTHHQRTFVDVNDGQVGLLVANRGLPEYEVMTSKKNENDGVIVVLTLLRCVGWLSRDDMHCRQRHAGPGLPTPGAQCPGRHTFEYTLVPFDCALRPWALYLDRTGPSAGGPRAQDRLHGGGWEDAYAQAHALNAPLRAVAFPASDGPLPSSLSFVQADPSDFVLTAVKQAKDSGGLIVRGYNITDETREVTLRLNRPFRRATRVNLNEVPQEELAANGNEVRFTTRAKQVVTVQFET